MWYSIKVGDDVEPRTAEEGDWGWAYKDWQTGTPPAIPGWTE